MPEWIVVCPSCGSENETDRNALLVECGEVYCVCVCSNCSTEFEGRQELWRWLGLEEAPPAE
jgi:hypothetical protein